MKKLLVTAMCLLLLAGCGRNQPEPTETVTVPTTAATVPSVDYIFPEEAPTDPLPEEIESPVPQMPQPVQPEPWQTVPVPTYPQIPEFTNLEEFRAYLYHQVDAGNLNMTIRYTGFPSDLAPQTIARIGNLLYVQCLPQGDLYEITLWEYPGQRMVRAYRTGDRSGLREGEALALDTAIVMVDQARTDAVTPLELELRLFDMLRETVRYNEGTTEIMDPEAPPRYLTALGALLDGNANCQGYTDAMYVLLSVAGFENSKMHVDIPTGGHVVNTVCVGGNWYVLDATFSDYDDPTGIQISYRLFNAGVDKCTEYSWEPVMERYFLSRQTDSNYYYYSNLGGDNKVYGDLDSMAEGILNGWQQQGKTEHYVMLTDANVGWAELGDALNRAANLRGLYISYDIWVENNRRDTFFFVRLS